MNMTGIEPKRRQRKVSITTIDDTHEKDKETISEGRKIRQVDRTRHTDPKANFTGGVANRHLSERKIEEFIKTKGNVDNLNKAFKEIKRKRDYLNKNKSKKEIDTRQLLNRVMEILAQFEKSSSSVRVNHEIFKELQENQEPIDNEYLLEVIDQTLDDITFIKNSIKKGGGNVKLYKNISSKCVESDLKASIKESDVETVRDILEQRSKDVKGFNLKELSELALDAKKEDSTLVLQLLVNNKLLSIDDLDDKLQEAITYAKDNNKIRMGKLLTKIKNRTANKELYADVPIIAEGVEKNTTENLNQLEKYIREDKSSKIKEMITSGEVDLRNLNDEQSFSILKNTANKINPKTIGFLQDNGFDISVTNNEKALLEQTIDAKNLAMVKYLLGQIKKSSEITLQQHLDRVNLIVKAHTLAENKDVDKKKQKNATEIASLIEKKFELSKSVVELCDDIKDIRFNEIKKLVEKKKFSKKIGTEARYRILLLAVDGFNDHEMKAYNGKILEILTNNGFNLETKDEKGNNILTYASYKGKEDAVKWLLEQKNGKKLVNETNNSGLSPIMYAAMSKEFSHVVMHELINSGANLYLGSNNNFSPLMCAATPEAVNYLCGYEDIENLIDAKDDKGNNALHYAIQNGYTDVVEALLSHDAGTYIKNANKDTPLELAGKKSKENRSYDPRIISMLEEEHGKEQSVRDNKLSGFLINIKTLFAHKAKAMIDGDQIDLKSMDSTTKWIVLQRSVTAGVDFIKSLADKGLDLKTENSAGYNIFTIAAQTGEKNVIEWLLKEDEFKDLIKQTSGIALIEAVRNSHKGTVKKLLAQNFKLKVPGLTALMVCENKKIAQLLLENEEIKASINETDPQGNTALHYAIQNGYIDVAEALLEMDNIDISTTNHDGDTALQVAEKIFGSQGEEEYGAIIDIIKKKQSQ